MDELTLKTKRFTVKAWYSDVRLLWSVTIVSESDWTESAWLNTRQLCVLLKMFKAPQLVSREEQVDILERFDNLEL